MKKLFSILLAAAMLMTPAALADDALDAFYALTGQKTQQNPAKTAAEYLADIVSGAYAAPPADAAAQAALASELKYLNGITMRDIAAYASANQLPVRQVRNAYYKTLAGALSAEIAVNPAGEEQFRNLQVLLSLFLNEDGGAGSADRAAIRSSMTEDKAEIIAEQCGLPDEFIEFIIMDENWRDDRWDNDDDWRSALNARWDDDADDLRRGVKDSGGSTMVADLQEGLIALGYLSGKADGVFGAETERALKQYQLANGMPATGTLDDDDIGFFLNTGVVARWDYQNSFDTPDNTPDTPDRNTPDTPDTPDRNTPDTPDTPDQNTPDTPDYRDSDD